MEPRIGVDSLDTIPNVSSTLTNPLNLPACLRFIWSRFFFPGTSDAATSFSRRAILLFAILPAILLYPCLSFHLFEPDEGRYAEIPREMLARGEWIVPYLQGEPYLDKPPLLYWLVMASFRVFGVYDWSARLIPALAIHASIMVTYLLGRRSLGERASFWGALALCLAPGFISMGRLLVLDGLLTLWVTLGLFCAYEAVRGRQLRWSWWLASAGACGLGVLTKGPVAVLLLIPPILTFRWLSENCCRTGWKPWLLFAGIVFGISAPWYAAVCIRMPTFIRHFLWEHNVVRFLSPFDHQEPIWFYGPIVLAGLMPATLLLVPLARFLLTSDAVAVRRRCPELGFMLLAGGWCLLFFSLSGCKLPTYIMPALPPFALVFGYYFAGSSWQIKRWPRVVALGWFALLCGGHYVAMPWYARFHSPMSRPEVMAGYCGDRNTPVVCFPRNCDSVAFYLGRDDLRNYRSKQISVLLPYLQRQPRTVVIFTHRHSPASLKHALPPEMHLTKLTPISKSWGNAFRTEFCYMGIVERRP